ncbi:MAG: hypothetical protein ACRC68_13530 [Clostridium sp.]
MTDVRKVFVTKEIADELDVNPSYLLRVAKQMNLEENEMRDTGKRNYLFSIEAKRKLEERFNKNK